MNTGWDYYFDRTGRELVFIAFLEPREVLLASGG